MGGRGRNFHYQAGRRRIRGNRQRALRTGHDTQPKLTDVTAGLDNCLLLDRIVSEDSLSMNATRTRLSGKEREMQILRAATAVFARSNYRVASTADIPAPAGIAEPTVFKYFPTKKSLFLRILDGTGKAILHVWQR